MSREEIDYLFFIRNEFDGRLRYNPQYSLRAFARDLDISPSRLSEILNRKGGLSEKSAIKIAKKLKLNLEEQSYFLALVNHNFSRSKEKQLLARKVIQDHKNNKYFMLSSDTFKLISDWEYYAILSAVQLDAYTGNDEWLAKKLDITLERLEECFRILLKLKLLKIEKDRYILVNEKVSTTDGIPSFALRASHKQNLIQAMESVDGSENDLRNISSISMAIDKSKLPEAFEKIKKFRRELSDFLEDGERNEVYNLNVQLIPISKNT
ncbi:TIGR02147 family protein [Bacteriovoracaceae bacterium]|nr:TIGR02147 family protein [Bacteriovoracaceae bacterium]